LRRIGLKKEKKEGGISWLITRREIDDIKERMGMIEPKQTTLDYGSVSAVCSDSSVLRTNSTNETESTELNEVNDEK